MGDDGVAAMAARVREALVPRGANKGDRRQWTVDRGTARYDGRCETGGY